MEHGFYHPSRGYWQTISDPDENTLSQYPEGTIEVPIIPGPGYTFNGSSWQPPTIEWKTEKAAARIRFERNNRLATEVDPIVTNPLRWEDMAEEQQNSWKQYRRELLDLTANPSFPWAEQVYAQGIDAVPWPTRPAWPN